MKDISKSYTVWKKSVLNLVVNIKHQYTLNANNMKHQLWVNNPTTNTYYEELNT